MGTVTINGKTYSGNSISISNGKVIIDGKNIEDTEISESVLTIKIEGSVETVITDKSVECGSVKGDVISGGSVCCDNVGGNVEACGSVSCDNVGGNVDSGGSVSCDSITGLYTQAGSGGAIRGKDIYSRKAKSETILGKIAKAFGSRIR